MVPHAQHGMDVTLDSAGIGRHQVGLCWLLSHVLYNWLHNSDNLILLLWSVQVGNISGVQDIVDVLKE